MGPKLGNSNRVAKTVAGIIDDFWASKISRDDATNKLKEIVVNPDNRVKIKRGDEYTGVFKNIMGIRRINTFEQLVDLNSIVVNLDWGNYEKRIWYK